MKTKQAKIVVVNSRKAILKKLINCLFEGGYRSIVCTQHICECLDLVRKEKPDLIIMDWEANGDNSISVIEKMRKGKQFHRVPVMMYTGTRQTKDQLKSALGAGVVQFIAEPFDQKEYILRVDNLIRISGMNIVERRLEEAKQLKHQNVQLRQKLDKMQREKRLGRLRESHWNDFMSWLINQLHLLSEDTAYPPEEIKPVLKRLINDCNNKKNLPLWKELKLRIVENHLEAFQQLIKDYPALTVNDLRLLAFVRLQLSTKEIANLTFKPVNTIKAARKRIRNKLGIARSNQSLVAFLSQY